MKKSILAALLATVSVSALANTAPIEDNVIWTGTVPAIVAANDDMYIKALNDLDAQTLTFERAIDGTLSLTASTVGQFEVLAVSNDLPTAHNVTLTAVAATAGTTAMPAGSWTIAHNGTDMAQGAATVDSADAANISIALTPAGLAELQPLEEVEVVVTATLSVAAPL